MRKKYSFGNWAIGMNGCQIIQLTILAIEMEKVGLYFSDAFLLSVSDASKTTFTNNELLKVSSCISPFASIKTIQKSKYTRQQHMLAIKHSNRTKYITQRRKKYIIDFYVLL